MSPNSNKPEESASYTIKCKGCGYHNPPQNNFCGRCGQTLLKADLSTPQEEPDVADIPTSYQSSAAPLPTPGAGTQIPRQTASPPTPQPVVQASSQTAPPLREPVSERQSAPIKALPPSKSTNRSNQTNKWLPYVLGVVALLVICCIFIGGILLVRNLRNVSSLRADTKPPNYGAFLKENGRFIEMPLYQGSPDSKEIEGIPQTENTQPLIILWHPETNLDYLQLAHSESGSVPYDVTPKPDGVLEIRAQSPLEQGRYCLIQGGPDIPYLLTPNWCFQVGLETTNDEGQISHEDTLAFYAQNVRIGDNALAAIEEDEYLRRVVHPTPKEGWQYVLIDVIIENTGQTPVEQDLDLDYKQLIDSGGYQRELETYGILATHPCELNKSYWLPGIRYKSEAVTQIPINQTPSFLNIRMNGYDSGDLSLDAPAGELAVPFDSPPRSIPMAQAGMLEYTTEGYSFRIKDFKFEFDESDSRFYWIATLDIVNSGGYDLDRNKISDLLKLVGMTDQGDLIGGGSTWAWVDIENIPPGQTGQTVIKQAIDGESKWIWLTILSKDCKGVTQIVVPVQ